MAPNLRRGFFSLLCWSDDAVQGSVHHLGVLLVDEQGEFAHYRCIEPVELDSRLKSLDDRGFYSLLLRGLAQRFSGESRPALADLQALHETLRHALFLSEPRPVLLEEPRDALTKLFLRHVRPHQPAPDTLELLDVDLGAGHGGIPRLEVAA